MPVDKEKLRLDLIEYTCGQRCMGYAGNRGGCCNVGSRDWIIGPIRDVEAFLARLGALLGRPVKREEAFIDYEEGRKLFPDRPMWQAREHYPALRVITSDPSRPCRYYDSAGARCSVYAIRPEVCRAWSCEHLDKVVSLL